MAPMGLRRLGVVTVLLTTAVATRLCQESHAEVSRRVEAHSFRRRNRQRIEPPSSSTAAHLRHRQASDRSDKESALAPTLAAPSTATTATKTTPRLSTTLPVLDQARRQFQFTRQIAFINILINAFRPDPFIIWPLRVPRILWELSIAIVADQAAVGMQDTLCLLLAVMTWITGLTDIFLWSPIFATMASFETCTSDGKWWWWWAAEQHCTPDYVRGYGRLVVVAQCNVFGLVYLLTSLVAWNAFRSQRDEQKVERELAVLAQAP